MLPMIVGNPGHPAGIPNPQATGHGLFGMRKAHFGPALGPAGAGYYPPGIPPPLAVPGAVANPAVELFGQGVANATGTQPATGVPFGAHPLKVPPPLAAPGWQHLVTLVLRFRHYPTPAAIMAGAPAGPYIRVPVAAVAGRSTRLVWRVRLANPHLLPQLPQCWEGCATNWAAQHDATHAAPAGLVFPGAPLHPWQHRCVVQQQDPATGLWIDVGHINMGESGSDCYSSSPYCPLDAASGFPPVTEPYRAPGLVLGLLEHLVGAPAAGLQPTLAFLRHGVEYNPGYFTEENNFESHVFMRIFAPPGHAYPAHALPAPGASPFHDGLLFALKLLNPPAPAPGHNPFWRYCYYMH